MIPGHVTHPQRTPDPRTAPVGSALERCHVPGVCRAHFCTLWGRGKRQSSGRACPGGVSGEEERRANLPGEQRTCGCKPTGHHCPPRARGRADGGTCAAGGWGRPGVRERTGRGAVGAARGLSDPLCPPAWSAARGPAPWSREGGGRGAGGRFLGRPGSALHGQATALGKLHLPPGEASATVCTANHGAFTAENSDTEGKDKTNHQPPPTPGHSRLRWCAPGPGHWPGQGPQAPRGWPGAAPPPSPPRPAPGL